jgi:hypothetical protein
MCYITGSEAGTRGSGLSDSKAPVARNPAGGLAGRGSMGAQAHTGSGQ